MFGFHKTIGRTINKIVKRSIDKTQMHKNTIDNFYRLSVYSKKADRIVYHVEFGEDKKGLDKHWMRKRCLGWYANYTPHEWNGHGWGDVWVTIIIK